MRGEEVEDSGGVFEGGEVGARDDLEAGAGDGVGELAAGLGRDGGVAFAADDEGGGGDAAEVGALVHAADGRAAARVPDRVDRAQGGADGRDHVGRGVRELGGEPAGDD